MTPDRCERCGEPLEYDIACEGSPTHGWVHAGSGAMFCDNHAQWVLQEEGRHVSRLADGVARAVPVPYSETILSAAVADLDLILDDLKGLL